MYKSLITRLLFFVPIAKSVIFRLYPKIFFLGTKLGTAGIRLSQALRVIFFYCTHCTQKYRDILRKRKNIYIHNVYILYLLYKVYAFFFGDFGYKLKKKRYNEVVKYALAVPNLYPNYIFLGTNLGTNT